MSHIGTVITACIPRDALPARLNSLDDLAHVPLDEACSVLIFSRNDWINNRLDELFELERVALWPARESPAVVVDASDLDPLIADLDGLLQALRRDPRGLPYSARENADDAEFPRAAGLAPPSLAAALAALGIARSRDEECESLDTLVCLLWCQLRLAQHARTNGLALICVRST